MRSSSSCDCWGSVDGWCQCLPCVLQSYSQMLWYKRISPFNPHFWDLGTLFCISGALAIFLSGRCGCLAYLVAFGMAAHGRVQILPVYSWIPSKLRDRDAKSSSTLHPTCSWTRALAVASQPSMEHLNYLLMIPGSTFQPHGLDPGFLSISPDAPRFKAALNCFPEPLVYLCIPHHSSGVPSITQAAYSCYKSLLSDCCMQNLGMHRYMTS